MSANIIIWCACGEAHRLYLEDASADVECKCGRYFEVFVTEPEEA